ncbi:MAG: twin-arginine translocase subunit TatC, partial [Chloroflexi bacterium]|nr:twin-arginine translocase subunit TatC [Chloroflexota bacterium]
MRNFLRGIWRVITFPFRLIFNILAFPFRKIYQFYKFLNTEPEERPLADVFADIVTKADTRQMLWDEIENLRRHLLRSIVFLALMVGVSFTFTRQIIEFLARPVGGIENLVAIEVTESIGVFMKVSLFSGLALSIPYIAVELWWFAAPGLKPRERKMGLAGIPLAAIFFVGGAAFTFFIMLPAAL